MVAGNIWEIIVAEGQHIQSGDTLAIIESMKMEIQVTAPEDGIVCSIRKPTGSQVNAGQSLIWLEVHE
jgi:urea carboxylase